MYETGDMVIVASDISSLDENIAIFLKYTSPSREKCLLWSKRKGSVSERNVWDIVHKIGNTDASESSGDGTFKNKRLDAGTVIKIIERKNFENFENAVCVETSLETWSHALVVLLRKGERPRLLNKSVVYASSYDPYVTPPSSPRPRGKTTPPRITCVCKVCCE